MRNVPQVYLCVGVQRKCWWVSVCILPSIINTIPKRIVTFCARQKKSTVVKEEEFGEQMNFKKGK